MKSLITTFFCCFAVSAIQADAPQLDIAPRILPSIEQTEGVKEAALWSMPLPTIKKKKKTPGFQNTWYPHSLSVDGVTVTAHFPQTPMLQEEGGLKLLIACDPLTASLYALSLDPNVVALEDYERLDESQIIESMQSYGVVTSITKSETSEGLPCWNYTVNVAGQGTLQGRLFYAHGYIANAFTLSQKGGRAQVDRFLDNVHVE